MPPLEPTTRESLRAAGGHAPYVGPPLTFAGGMAVIDGSPPQNRTRTAACSTPAPSPRPTAPRPAAPAKPVNELDPTRIYSARNAARQAPRTAAPTTRPAESFAELAETIYRERNRNVR